MIVVVGASLTSLPVAIGLLLFPLYRTETCPIREGMSVAEVESILGRPADHDRQVNDKNPDYRREQTWDWGDTSIQVLSDEQGTVTGLLARYPQPEPTWTERVRRWLGL
jgi:hypothetical protein